MHKCQPNPHKVLRCPPKSLPDLTDTHVSKSGQIPPAMFKHLVESQKSGRFYTNEYD